MKKFLSILLSYAAGAAIGLSLALMQLGRDGIQALGTSRTGADASPVDPNSLPPDMPTSSVPRGAMHVELRPGVKAHADD